MNAAYKYSTLKQFSHRALALVVLSIGIASILFVRHKISPALRARNHVEQVIKVALVLYSTIAIAVFITIGIVMSVFYESIRFFRIIPVTDFLFGLKWSPQMPIREDQVG